MGSEYIAPVERLIEAFRALPGIGRKTATRMAFGILDFSREQTEAFAQALIEAKEQIRPCRVCQNLCDSELCSVCADSERDTSVLCVVEDARALMAMEKVREYRGVYHVLGGVLSPLNGVGPDQLHIPALMKRLEEGSVKEVILATNPTVEGETTAMYLTRLIKPLGIKVSRLAYGIPVGGDLEYADAVTLLRAVEGRQEM
jgi:recombination protein RecR